MNQSEFNFLNMSDRVMSHMLLGRSIWENEPEIVEVVEIINELKTRISENRAIESGLSVKGLTSAKDNTLDSLATKSCKLSKKISGYAKKNGLLELIPLVNHSVSTITRGPEKQMINRCKAITGLAVKHMDNLKSFSVKQAEIDHINHLIAEYQNHIDNRSNTHISKSSTGEEISNDISKMRDQYDILDDLVEGSLDDNVFIRDYKAARVIDDYGKGKTLKNKDKK